MYGKRSIKRKSQPSSQTCYDKHHSLYKMFTAYLQPLLSLLTRTTPPTHSTVYWIYNVARTMRSTMNSRLWYFDQRYHVRWKQRLLLKPFSVCLLNPFVLVQWCISACDISVLAFINDINECDHTGIWCNEKCCLQLANVAISRARFVLVSHTWPNLVTTNVNGNAIWRCRHKLAEVLWPTSDLIFWVKNSLICCTT